MSKLIDQISKNPYSNGSPPPHVEGTPVPNTPTLTSKGIFQKIYLSSHCIAKNLGKIRAIPFAVISLPPTKTALHILIKTLKAPYTLPHFLLHKIAHVFHTKKSCSFAHLPDELLLIIAGYAQTKEFSETCGDFRRISHDFTFAKRNLIALTPFIKDIPLYREWIDASDCNTTPENFHPLFQKIYFDLHKRYESLNLKFPLDEEVNFSLLDPSNVTMIAKIVSLGEFFHEKNLGDLLKHPNFALTLKVLAEETPSEKFISIFKQLNLLNPLQMIASLKHPEGLKITLQNGLSLEKLIPMDDFQISYLLSHPQSLLIALKNNITPEQLQELQHHQLVSLFHDVKYLETSLQSLQSITDPALPLKSLDGALLFSLLSHAQGVQVFLKGGGTFNQLLEMNDQQRSSLFSKPEKLSAALASLPELKIDQDFLRGMHGSKAFAILRHIANLADALRCGIPLDQLLQLNPDLLITFLSNPERLQKPLDIFKRLEIPFERLCRELDIWQFDAFLRYAESVEIAINKGYSFDLLSQKEGIWLFALLENQKGLHIALDHKVPFEKLSPFAPSQLLSMLGNSIGLEIFLQNGPNIEEFYPLTFDQIDKILANLEKAEVVSTQRALPLNTEPQTNAQPFQPLPRNSDGATEEISQNSQDIDEAPSQVNATVTDDFPQMNIPTPNATMEIIYSLIPEQEFNALEPWQQDTCKNYPQGLTSAFRSGITLNDLSLLNQDRLEALLTNHEGLKTTMNTFNACGIPFIKLVQMSGWQIEKILSKAKKLERAFTVFDSLHISSVELNQIHGSLLYYILQSPLHLARAMETEGKSLETLSHLMDWQLFATLLRNSPRAF